MERLISTLIGKLTGFPKYAVGPHILLIWDRGAFQFRNCFEVDGILEVWFMRTGPRYFDLIISRRLSQHPKRVGGSLASQFDFGGCPPHRIKHPDPEINVVNYCS